jgi:Zn-finger domain-containing protein
MPESGLDKGRGLRYRIGFFHPTGGNSMSKHKKIERHKELDRRRKRRKERLKERVREAIAAKKA